MKYNIVTANNIGLFGFTEHNFSIWKKKSLLKKNILYFNII